MKEMKAEGEDRKPISSKANMKLINRENNVSPPNERTCPMAINKCNLLIFAKQIKNLNP